MKNLAILGCGNIARFHIPAMIACGFNISAISGRPGTKEYLNKFAQEFGLGNVEVFSNPIDLLNCNKWDAILLSCPTSAMLDYLKLALIKGKPILAEKPVSYKPSELKEFFKYQNIRVAYNRRFYNTVQYAKEFNNSNKKSIIKVSIPESSNIKLDSKDFPKKLPVKSYENSVHVIDTIRYISGEINWSHHESIKNKNNYEGLIGIGKSESGNVIILDSCFNSSENFSIQLIKGSKRLILKPLEVAKLYDGMKIVQPSKDLPIRTYTPILKNQLIETDANNIKLGFRSQAIDFKNFCNGKMSSSATIYDSYKALQLMDNLK